MSDHVVPVRVYVTIFLALMVLTALTVRAAFIDLGPMNNVIMLGIAVTKATLVVLYFMHVRYSDRLTWILVSTGFVFVAVMVLITISDPISRGWLGTPGS